MTSLRNIQFSEVQQFRQTWLWYLLLFSFLISMVPVLVLTLRGDLPRSEGIAVMSLMLVIMAIILGLFNVATLETKISDEGIAFRWTPFFKRFTLLKWSDIDYVQIRQYLGLSYGFHFSFRYGRMHNVSGNYGLQVVLKNGKRYFLGTQKRSSAERALQQSGKMKL